MRSDYEGYVFISGPYQGYSKRDYTAYLDIDANINEARRWAVALALKGIPFFAPHLNSFHMEVIAPEVPSDFWLHLDMQILRGAAAILMLPNWKSSKGSMAELEEARRLEMPVFTTSNFDQLVTFWEQERHKAIVVKGEGVYAIY